MQSTCLILFFSILSMIMRAHAQLTTVTLFDIVAPTPSLILNPNSKSFSVLGTNSEGATSYLEIIEESLLLVPDFGASTTEFVTVSPTDIAYTIVADGSGITWNQVASGSADGAVAETCTWGSDGLGECVVAVQFPGETTTATTLTVSGPKFAFATLTESIPTSSATQATNANRASSLRLSAKVTGMVATAILVGCFLVV